MNKPASSNPLGPFKASFGDQQIDTPPRKASEKDDGSEFGEFTSLTEKLLSVPKSELDERRKA